MRARRTASRIACAARAGASVSLKAPRNALPIGVRAVETMTASRMIAPVSRSEIPAAQRVRDARRLVVALAFDGQADLDLNAAPDVLGPENLGATTHPAAGAHGAREAHAVAPVVDAHLRAVGLQQLWQEVVDERQRQETVGDGAAERSRARALGVDMDPLVITGGIRELV